MLSTTLAKPQKIHSRNEIDNENNGFANTKTFLPICRSDTRKSLYGGSSSINTIVSVVSKVSISNTIPKFIYIWQLFIFIVCLTNWAKKLLKQWFWWSYTWLHATSNMCGMHFHCLFDSTEFGNAVLAWKKVYIAIMTPFSLSL